MSRKQYYYFFSIISAMPMLLGKINEQPPILLGLNILLVISLVYVSELFPRKRYTCWRFVYEACAIKAEKKSH